MIKSGRQIKTVNSFLVYGLFVFGFMGCSFILPVAVQYIFKHIKTYQVMPVFIFLPFVKLNFAVYNFVQDIRAVGDYSVTAGGNKFFHVLRVVTGVWVYRQTTLVHFLY